MIEITIGIHPDPLLVAQALEAASVDIVTSEGPMMSSLEHLMASIDRAFMEQGPGWEPWSEAYAKSYGSAHGPLFGQEDILIRTAEMIAASQDEANYAIGHDSIAWEGSATPEYTDFHLEGTVKMPERNFLRVDEIAQEAIDRDWADWLSDIIARASAISFRGGAFRDAAGRFARKP